jgi:hypothetical protein
MANLSQTFRGTATLEFPITPTIYNVTTAATPGTETSQALTSGTKQFLIRVRGVANLQYSYVATQSGSNFITVPPRSTRVVTDINFSGTIYFQVDKPSQVVEIEEWGP